MSNTPTPRRALVVIDVQNEYFEGGGLPIEYPPIEDTLPNVTKAMDAARRNMVKVSLKNGSIHHNVRGHHGAAKVLMAPAPAGTGIIAGGPMRAVFEVMGITDIVAKSLGSSNPYNMVRATLDALNNATTPADIAAKRGKSVEDILG